MDTSKPILFCDFDGTICHDRYWRSLPAEKYTQVQELLFQGDMQKANDWMRGTYTAEEVNQFVAESIGMPYAELWDLFVQDCRTMRVKKEILEKLSALRQRYTVILITGNMDSFSRFSAPVLSLENYFDHISNSYYEGVSKTDNDGDLFAVYATKYGVQLSDCVLLDDNAAVCTIFERLGGKPYLVSSTHNVEYYIDQL